MKGQGVGSVFYGSMCLSWGITLKYLLKNGAQGNTTGRYMDPCKVTQSSGAGSGKGYHQRYDSSKVPGLGLRVQVLGSGGVWDFSVEGSTAKGVLSLKV